MNLRVRVDKRETRGGARYTVKVIDADATGREFVLGQGLRYTSLRAIEARAIAAAANGEPWLTRAFED